MEFILSSANDYAVEHSSCTGDLLKEIEAFVMQHHREAHMLSGPVQGLFLGMISKMIKPKKILEIGTFVGYSALCLAGGLAPDGTLHTIEKREEDAATAMRYVEKSEFADRITVHHGEAMEIITQLKEDWNLIFVDADKTGYLEYYQYLIEKVSPGTWFIFDNVLFHGEVLHENIKGKSAKAIAAFNDAIRQDERVEKVMLTIRDGLTLMYKK